MLRKTGIATVMVIMGLVVFLTAGTLLAREIERPEVQEIVDGYVLTLRASSSFNTARLTVSGPDGFRWSQTYDERSIISFSAMSEGAELLPDGAYTYELVLVSASQQEGVGDTPAPFQREKALAREVYKYFGEFTLEGSAITITPQNRDDTAGLHATEMSGGESEPGTESGESTEATGPVLKAADHFSGDVTIEGQLCVGNQCIASYNPGPEDLNLTSSAAPGISFRDLTTSPTFNYEFEAFTGGMQIYDYGVGGGVFRIETGVPVSTLYMASEGIIGIGTNNPSTGSGVQGLDINKNSFPATRLIETGSGQTWAWWGGGSAAGLYDETAGTSPFVVQAGAPQAALWVSSSGNVGIGTSGPSQALHVFSNAGDKLIQNENTNSTAAERVMFRLINNGKIRFVLNNTQAGASWTFDNDGNFTISKVGTGVNEMLVDGNGNMVIQGTLTQLSDVNAKTEIEPVDELEILKRVIGLPIAEWSYRDDGPSVRHIGPMAQDFYDTFSVGQDRTGISTMDTSGVALAAIKGLHAQVEDLAETNARLEQENHELKQRLQAIEEALAVLR